MCGQSRLSCIVVSMFHFTEPLKLCRSLPLIPGAAMNVFWLGLEHVFLVGGGGGGGGVGLILR